jgi:flagellar L-ring protein precursor FlgH
MCIHRRCFPIYSGFIVLVGCAGVDAPSPRIPSREYADSVRGAEIASAASGQIIKPAVASGDVRAQLVAAPAGGQEQIVLPETSPIDSGHQGIRAPEYSSPLPLGQPGQDASLWREGQAAHTLFHDFRAFQPMDLVTVLITENSEGRKQADTKVNSQSTLRAAISALFGLEKSTKDSNPNIDPTSLINATTTSQFDGKGETLRRGTLRGTISAMVQEVLPSGVLRIQGEKIISVNDEEQVMVLSGLVRPRDVNSRNEVDSAKIANVRIDYFGKGSLAGIQSPGWLTRAILSLWPF